MGNTYIVSFRHFDTLQTLTSFTTPYGTSFQGSAQNLCRAWRVRCTNEIIGSNGRKACVGAEFAERKGVRGEVVIAAIFDLL